MLLPILIDRKEKSRAAARMMQEGISISFGQKYGKLLITIDVEVSALLGVGCLE